MDRIYNKKIILSQHQSIIDYFNLLIYIDPILFEHHFRIMVSQISSDLTKIIQKEQKILEQFIVISENST